MKSKSQTGQALIEFAIILPLLLLIIFGIIEFSILLYDKAVITNASREGARYGIVARDPRYTDAEINSVVQSYCSNNLITSAAAGNITVVSIHPSQSFGDPLQVTVTYTYSFFTNIKTLTLQAATTMRYE
jgi:Flp pilus assembly protein TadG